MHYFLSSVVAHAMVSEKGCQSISILAPEEDTSTRSVTELLQDIAKEKSNSPGTSSTKY